MLPRRHRLSETKDIKAVLRAKQWRGESLTLSFVAKENRNANSRVAIVTPKRLGNAIVRNRLKRLCCAAFLTISNKLSKNVDLVLFPKKAALEIKSGNLAQQTIELLSNNIV